MFKLFVVKKKKKKKTYRNQHNGVTYDHEFMNL